MSFMAVGKVQLSRVALMAYLYVVRAKDKDCIIYASA